MLYLWLVVSGYSGANIKEHSVQHYDYMVSERYFVNKFLYFHTEFVARYTSDFAKTSLIYNGTISTGYIIQW